MMVLDSDHLSLLQHPESSKTQMLLRRMDASPDQEFATSAISLEEQFQGWLAYINRFPDVYRQIPAYERLVGLVEFFARWVVLPFDQAAADEFTRLRQAKVRIATMDLKIASIVLVHRAQLLTSNRRHFQKVPGLQIQNWIS